MCTKLVKKTIIILGCTANKILKNLNDNLQGYRKLNPICIFWNTDYELLRNTTINKTKTNDFTKTYLFNFHAIRRFKII